MLYRVHSGDLLEIEGKIYKITFISENDSKKRINRAYLKYLKFENPSGEILFDNKCIKCDREQTKFSPLCEIHFSEEMEKVIA